MNKKNNKSTDYLYTVLLLFLISLIITDNDILKKTYKILSNENYSKRIEKRYGFCENSSIGYIRHIKKKYQINFNPKIINFKKTAPLNWSIYNLNYKKDYNKMILLNYKKNLDLFFTKENNNTWVYKESVNKLKSIDQIKINTYNGESVYMQGKINLYKVDTKNKKKLIYSWMINQNIDVKSIKTNYQSNKLHTVHERLIIELEVTDNTYLNEISSIILSGKNIVDIDKFNIINQIQNCYYVSTRN